MSKSTPQSVDPPEDIDQLVERFLQDLERQETSPKTRSSYRLDLLHFAAWFARTVGESFSPEAVTPTDVREYRSYLSTVEKRQPATVNRRLAALRRFFQWAKTYPKQAGVAHVLLLTAWRGADRDDVVLARNL